MHSPVHLHPPLEGAGPRPAHVTRRRADPARVTTARSPRGAARRGRGPALRPSLPVRRPSAEQYDAEAALDSRLAGLRSALGASCVSVWVYEASTGTAAPYRHSVCPGADVAENPALTYPVTVARSPFVSTVIAQRRPLVRADGRRPADREAARYGIRSAHGEPLVCNGEVVGVLTIEPAAAASPAPLHKAMPGIALAMTEAWRRRTERRRLDSADVLLGLVERASQAPSVEQLLAVACRQLAELGEVERACVFLVEDGTLVPRMARYADGRRDEAAWERFPYRARAASPGRDRAAHRRADGRRPRDSGELSGWWADTFSAASALAVPLGSGPSLTGVLTLDSTRLQPFSEEVRRMASAAGATPASSCRSR